LTLAFALGHAGGLTDILLQNDDPRIDGRAEGSGADRPAALTAAAIVVALIGALVLPMLHVAANGVAVSGAKLIRDRSELCFDCVEDAPYPMLLWLELIVVLGGLVAALGLCIHGEGGKTVARTIVLSAAALVLLWAPFQTQSRDRPIGVVLVLEAMGIAVLVIAVLVRGRSGTRWILVARAIVLIVALIALLTIPGTRRQMPFTYDRLLWGYIVTVVATAAASVAAIATRKWVHS
jgi:hypothetical protein